MAKSICAVDVCESPAVTRAFCGKHYANWRRTGEPLRRTVEQRFWAKVNVRDGCWGWAASVFPNGYAQFHAGWTQYAHRYAYALLVGPIPDGFDVDHVRARGCLGGVCTKPEHLEAVEHAENMARMDHSTCRRGHPMTPENTLTYPGTGHRTCRTCRRVTHHPVAATGAALLAYVPLHQEG